MDTSFRAARLFELQGVGWLALETNAATLLYLLDIETQRASFTPISLRRSSLADHPLKLCCTLLVKRLTATATPRWMRATLT